MNERYRRSTELLRRAREVIPLGSQTFSKSFVQYPAGAAPLFLERGRVALNSGTDFGTGGAGHVRLNLATSPEVITEAVRRMAAAL